MPYSKATHWFRFTRSGRFACLYSYWLWQKISCCYTHCWAGRPSPVWWTRTVCWAPPNYTGRRRWAWQRHQQSPAGGDAWWSPAEQRRVGRSAIHSATGQVGLDAGTEKWEDFSLFRADDRWCDSAMSCTPEISWLYSIDYFDGISIPGSEYRNVKKYHTVPQWNAKMYVSASDGLG